MKTASHALFQCIVMFACAARAAAAPDAPPQALDWRALLPGRGGAVRTFEHGKKPEREIFVSPSGDDSAAGTAEAPLKTISKAVSMARPGAAVRIMPGVYRPEPGRNGHITSGSLRGAAEAPIWIGGADPADRPVLIGGAGDGAHISRPAWLILHDLEIKYAGGNGVNIDDGGLRGAPDSAHHVVLRGIYAHDIGNGGNQDNIKLSGVNAFTVYDCETAKGGGDRDGGMSGSGLDMVGCRGGLVTRNYFHDAAANAVQVKGGSRDVMVRENIFMDCGERALNIGGSTGEEFFRPPAAPGADLFEARRISAVSNLIIGASAPFAFVSAADCTVSHNTIANPKRFLFRILQEGGARGVCARNTVEWNIFHHGDEISGAWRFVNAGPGTDPGSFRVEWNFFHNQSARARPPEFPPSVENIAYDFGKDPLFTEPARMDYRLQPGSPAAGYGCF